MNLRHLNEFIVFSKYVNFTAAAKKLFISQPALSNHMAALEKEIGVTLINRGETPSLTPAGRVLVKDASALIKLHDDAVERCRQAALQKNEVVIAHDSFLETAAGISYTEFRHLFRLAYPDIYITARPCTETTVSEILSEGDIDCVIVLYTEFAKDVEAGIVFERIPNHSNGLLGLWMHTSHPLAQKTSLVWDDLQGINHPFIATGSRIWTASVQELLKKHRISYDTRLIAEEGENFMYAFEDDDVQLFDTGMKAGVLSRFASRVFVPLGEEDAAAICMVAYEEDNDNPAFLKMLEFLHQYRE